MRMPVKLLTDAAPKRESETAGEWALSSEIFKKSKSNWQFAG